MVPDEEPCLSLLQGGKSRHLPRTLFMPLWTRDVTFSAATSPGPHGPRQAAALPRTALLPVGNCLTGGEEGRRRWGLPQHTERLCRHRQQESWVVFLALRNVLMRVVIQKGGKMVNQRRSVRQWDKQERGQHKTGKQTPGAEPASGKGQLCSPPRQMKKGKAKSGGHALRSIEKGTPGIAEEGAPTAGAGAEIPAGSSAARRGAPCDSGQGTTGGGELGQPDTPAGEG